MVQLLRFFVLISVVIKAGKIIAGRGDIRQIRVRILICQFSIYVKCLMVQLFRFFILVAIAVQKGKIIAGRGDIRQIRVCILFCQL